MSGWRDADSEAPGDEPERYSSSQPPLHRFPLDRREFLRVLGGGLVVLCLWRDAEAQESGGRRRRGPEAATPREIGAWLHIAEDGAVTAYTGKVEVGQDIRTSLAQAVADELHLPPESIRLVMGDTARVPFDRGTFGSRTTPTMAPQLRKAAAAARLLLVGLASKQWEVDRATVVVAEGKVTHPPTGRSLGFGELTKGRKLVEVIDEDVAITPADRREVAGRSVPKVDGRSFVTGGHKYTSDIKRPGMLRGKVLRPPAFDAKLVSLDTSKAEAMPGVTVVRDGDFVGVAAPDESRAAKALQGLRSRSRSASASPRR